MISDSVKKRGDLKKLFKIIIIIILISAQIVEAKSIDNRVNNKALNKSLNHLEITMDKYHKAFDVYSDIGSAGNHFVHRAMMGTEVTIDDAFNGTVHLGTTAIRNTFSGRNSDWGGWYFQNGVLLSGGDKPVENWGDHPNAGYNLSGATKLTFWAKGEKGGERVEFFALGVGRYPNSGISTKPFPDSEAKVTICGLKISPCFITLTDTWQEYTFNLTGLNLNYVIGGFGWVTNAPENSNNDIVFYLDDIYYNKVHDDDLRFLVSYETINSRKDFDLILRNVAFSYDNALALIAFTADKDWERAKILADSFLYAQEHDRYYTDGRLRNAYQAGDLIIPPGWISNDREKTARMPGWWNAEEQKWYEDRELVGSGTGNIAWVMISLLSYYEKSNETQYLDAVKTLGDWIETHTRDSRGAGGYTGGYAGWEPEPEKLLWKSTEHNIDLFVAFERLYKITGNSTWHERAMHAKGFVDKMWNSKKKHYWTGTMDDGIAINKQVIPLDVQAWALLAFNKSKRTKAAVAFASKNHRVSYGRYDGFDFNTDRDMPWFEGTAQMAVAYRNLGNISQARYFTKELREVQSTSVNGNGKGIVAAPADGLTTGFNWLYFNRLHVGATSWHIFAEQKINPYWS